MNKIIKERLQKFGYAIKGIQILFQTEVHGKFHIFFALFVIAAGIFFDITTIEWCMIIICISMVISAETFNAAIERLTDLASPDYHPLAGKAKDLAAGAVLICAIGAMIIGFIIFLPKVLAWLGLFVVPKNVI
jgi:diacylglycerol kinase